MQNIIKLFVFDDFYKLDANTIQKIIAISGISIKDWAFALKGYKEDVQSTIFACFDEIVSEKIWDEMIGLGLIYTSEMVEKQNYIVSVIRKLYRDGKI